MSAKYISNNWRLLNQENSSKNDNYGLTYNGSNEYIDLGSPSELDFQTGEMTLSCWIYSETVSSIKPILGNSNSGATSYQYLLDVNRTAAKISFLTSGVPTLTSNLTISANTWYHICLTRSGTTSNWVYTMYINGSSSDGGTLSTSTNPPATQTVAIGKYGALGGYYFQGKISNFSAFNKALTSTQISTLYGSSSLGSGNPMALKPQPVAYYPLGDNSASNPLTQPNVAVEDASVFNFDGSDDYVNLNTTLSSLGVTTSFSISTWVNISTLGIYDTVIGAPAAYGTWNDGFGLMVYNNALYFWVEDWNDANHFVQTATLNTSQWYHIVCTFSTSNGLKIYVDSGTPTTASNTEIGTLTFPMFIGSTGTNTTYVFNGEISNTQIWNTELSASDVSTLYNSGVPLYTGTQPQAANLKAWYKLNNTANWEADSSGNWQIPEATSAYPQSFKCDSGWIDLNGSNLAPILNGISNFTLSLWYKQDAISNRFVFDIKDGTNRMALQLVNAATNYLYFNSSYNSYSAVDTPINQWNNIVFVFDGSEANADRIKLYVNGSQITAAITGTIDSTLGSFGSSTVANLGAASTGGSLYALNGKISNCQIFNSSLPATGTDSVETLYNNGSPLTTAIASSNLKLWAKLDNNEKFDGTNWSVENQKYPAGFDSALDFDGSNYIQIPYNANLTPQTGNFTVSAWVNTDNLSGWHPIWSTLNLSSSTSTVAIHTFNNNIRVTIGRPTSGWALLLDSTATLNTNTWYHIAVTFDFSGNAQIYINGNADNSGAIGTHSTTWDTGDRYIGEGEGLWDGRVSNFSIYSSELSAAQITTLYNSGTPETAISLSPVSWWKLDNTTTGIQDSTGSNDGTNNGATKVNTFVSTEAATSSGMTGQNLVNNNVSTLNGESSGMTSANLVTSDLTRAIPYGDGYSFNFDGTDFINCGNFTGVNNSPTASWCGWFKPSGTTGGMLFSQWSATTSDQSILFSLSTSLTRIDIYLNTNIAFRASGGSALMVQDEWNFVCLTFNKDNAAADRLQLYINNSRVTETTGFSGPNANINNSTADFLIAGYYTTTQEFLGNISNFTIFNEELTSTEMLKLYANGVPQDLSSFTPQPVAWYPLGSNSFWNGSNWTVRDMSAGGSNDGTSANIGADGLVGDAPRSEANGTGANMDVPSNLEGNTKWSSNNSYSVNMSSEARKQDTP